MIVYAVLTMRRPGVPQLLLFVQLLPALCLGATSNMTEQPHPAATLSLEPQLANFLNHIADTIQRQEARSVATAQQAQALQQTLQGVQQALQALQQQSALHTQDLYVLKAGLSWKPGFTKDRDILSGIVRMEKEKERSDAGALVSIFLLFLLGGFWLLLKARVIR